MHNATKMMVAHDHIIKPPKFNVAMITEMKNKSLLSQIPKPTGINGICKQRLLFLYSTESENTQIYELRVGDGDVGKVIGKHGKNVGAIRTLLSAATAKEGGKRAILEIIE